MAPGLSFAAGGPSTQGERCYKLEIKVWTSFDPGDLDLTEIAARIEAGAGFLTALDVTKIAHQLSEIDDPEVRERFETIRAAQRLLRKTADLPPVLRQQLFAALNSDREEQQRIAE